MTMMRAARLYAPADIRCVPVEVPSPGAGEVLIRVEAVGVCGSDFSRVMVTGCYSYPTTMGHEFAGVVVELGSDVTGLSLGDRVTAVPLIPCGQCQYCLIGEYTLCDHYNYIGSRTDGAFAEFVKVPAANVLQLGESVDFESGAMTDPAAVAIHAVRKAGVRVGDRVAVFGAGPIGVLAAQWARIAGARQTVVVDILGEKLKIAEDLGVDLCLNSRQTDPVAAIRDATGGGVERVIETAGVPLCQEQGIRSLRKHGTIALCGITHKDLPLSEKAVDSILRGELTVLGSWNSGWAPVPGLHDWAAAVEFMGRGLLKARPLVSHRFTLDQVKDAFDLTLDRNNFFNKLMFLPQVKG